MELVLFVGLQASGKTSFYRARFAATHAHVSMDNFRNNRRPRQRQLVLADEALAAGRPVVVDNTNATALDRAPLLALARRRGVPAVGYYFDAPLAACLERNQAREGKARVPDVALYSTRKRLGPPSLSEGFAGLWLARHDGQGGWEVLPWPEP